MTLDEAKSKAKDLSEQHECSQFVLFRFERIVDGDNGLVQGYFYVSDWFDSDCTVAKYYKGEAYDE